MNKIAIIVTNKSLLSNYIFKYKLVSDDDSRDIYTNVYNNRKIIAMKCDTGKTSTASATQYLIDKYNVDAVINAGVAVGISKVVKLFDIVIGDVIYYDDLKYNFNISNTLINISKKVIELMDLNYYFNKIASGDKIIDKLNIKNDLSLKYDVAAIDLECASIAHTCKMNNVLFLPVKIIGETLNDKEENEESLIFKVSEVSSLIMDSIFDYFISQNNQDRIYLKIPEFDELDYYKEILADEKTMSYNSGYDLNLDGYDYESGCIKSFDVDKWYKKITTDKNRYFAYIIDSISNSPVGYVTFHLDEKTLKHRLGIVVNYSYRNRGYATKALKKICDIAFLKYGVNSLVVNIPYHMNYALKLAKKGGFIDTNNDYFVNKFGKRERCIVLELNKIDYID